MFELLGAFVVRHAKATLVVVALFLAASLAVLLRGGPLASGIIEGLEARQQEHVADAVTGQPAETTFVVVLRASDLDPRDEKFHLAVKEALAPLRSDPRVLAVMSADDAPPF
ncbi:MAG TPA: hypothetical protein VF407_18860 [Polyangiaceae bacterium]